MKLMTTSASATRASSAVISLTRNGVRSARRRSASTGCLAALPKLAVPAPLETIENRDLRGREPEDVANPAQGVDQPRIDRVDLPAEHGDVGRHNAGVAPEVVVPDVVEDLHLGQHPVGVAHEVPEHLELRGRQLDLLAGPPYLVAVLVEFQVGELEPRRGVAAVAPGAAEHRADPGD